MQPETAKIRVSDVALVEQYRGGDQGALEKLIIKYQGRIFNVILRICANRETAAELTQDTFVRIIENLHRFRGDSSFYTWAFRIAVNLTLNFIRRQKQVNMVSLDKPVVGDRDEARTSLRNYLAGDSKAEPFIVAQSKEAVELIIKAMMNLEQSQRAVIVLREIENMDYAHIASVLEIEIGTVKSRLSRARATLRANLEAILR